MEYVANVYLKELGRFASWGLAKAFVNENSAKYDGDLMIFKNLTESPLTAYMEDQYIVMECTDSEEH